MKLLKDSFGTVLENRIGAVDTMEIIAIEFVYTDGVHKLKSNIVINDTNQNK
jgi:hypothetical protein